LPQKSGNLTAQKQRNRTGLPAKHNGVLHNVTFDIKMIDERGHLGTRSDVRYRQVESALADVMGIKPKGMGAFRARLRHLRNIGLPQLPSPGSGQPIDYTQRQALELIIAMELEKIGQLPKTAAINAESIVRQSPYGQQDGKDCYAVVTEGKPGYTIAVGPRAFSEFMRCSPDVFLVINVSGCVRRLEAALNRTSVPD
jgi:hypothetical protein